MLVVLWEHPGNDHLPHLLLRMREGITALNVELGGLPENPFLPYYQPTSFLWLLRLPGSLDSTFTSYSIISTHWTSGLHFKPV